MLAESTVVTEIDASGGFDEPAKVTMQRVMRGDGALALRTGLSQLSKADAARLIKSMFSETLEWVEPESATWRYDETAGVLIMNFTGSGEPDWGDDAPTDRELEVRSVGFGKPAALRRPKEQDQDAPWTTDFPAYARRTTVVRLPVAPPGQIWAFNVDPLDVEIGGVLYWRDWTLQDDVLRATASSRAVKPEITAGEAEAGNGRRADFDDAVPRLFLRKAPDATVVAKAAAEVGDDAEKLLGFAAYRLQEGKAAETLTLVDRALKREPRSKPGLLVKVEALRQLGRVDDALRALDEAESARSDRDLEGLRASLLLQSGRKAEGLAALDFLATAHAGDAEFLSSLAAALLAQGEYDRAIAIADAGLELAPEDIVLNQVRAAVLSHRERWAEAMPHMETALRAHPEQPASLRNRAVGLRRLGRHDEALADIDEALRMDPLNTSNLAVKVRILRAAGRAQEAVGLYDRVPVRPGDAPAFNNRCWSRALADIELSKAETDCAEAVRLKPDSAAYWDSFGLVALRQGRLDEALRRYDRAVSLKPEHAASLYARGLTKLRRGDAAGGQADIAAAQVARPRVGDELADAGLRP